MADQKGEVDLGIAGSVAKGFITSPLSPLLFFAMLALGMMGLVLTPRQEDPQISVPMVDIQVMYPGASAEQVASLAIEPLERIVSEIPSVDHVYSASQQGMGIVTVQFEIGEDMNLSITKLRAHVGSYMHEMPPGVMPPVIKSKGIDSVSVVNITLWSKDEDGDGDPDVDDGIIRQVALDVQQSLKQVKNTGEVFIVGGRAEQVRIEVHPAKLSSYGVTLDQVAQTIQTANSEMVTGSVVSGGASMVVNVGKFLKSAEDIRNLVIGSKGSVPVYVRDIASVAEEPSETKNTVTFYTGGAYDYTIDKDEARAKTPEGMPAVTIAIAKQFGSNGVSVANEVIEKLDELRGNADTPGTLIPGNIGVDITRNYGQTANDKVDELIFKLFKATFFVVLLVWWAFRSMKPALVVFLIIPVVVLFTIFLAFIMGFTIDRVSLFALIFSIGILVDDAIVVVENIYRRWLENGSTDIDTAVDAVREVGNPTILATFAVIAALLPMGMVRGMMGPYMMPIPALGSVAMLFSLLAAFVFTPWLAVRYKPTFAYLKKAGKREHKESEKLERVFRRILEPLIDSAAKRRMFKLGMWGSFMAALSMFYFQMVEVKMLPLDNKPEFSVVIDMPEGTPLADTWNFATAVSEGLKGLKDEGCYELNEHSGTHCVEAVQAYVGTARPFDFNGMVRHYYLRQQPWQAEVQVQLRGKHDRSVTSHELALKTRAMVAAIVAADSNLKGAKFSVVEMPPGPPVLQSVAAEVHGPDAVERRKFAQQLTAKFAGAETLADVDNYIQDEYDYWRFEVDTEKAVRRGITVDAINRNLAMAMGGFALGDIKKASVLEPTKIVMQVPISVRSDMSRLYDLPVMSAAGTTVPLIELGTFSKVVHDPVIYHKDLRPIEYVVGDSAGNADGELAAPVYSMFEVNAAIEGMIDPMGNEVECTIFGGADSCSWYGAPPNENAYAFEWAGEWTVTYETFRDMGGAFMIAMVLIYILVVWEFGNFRVPGLIMAPIPLTLLGIIPAHAIMGAAFTATSMIGWIALAGIIVRNSILLVDFSAHAVAGGMSVRESVIMACTTRTRPIVITALALIAGSATIITDPIFQGMAISLAAGVFVSTALTLIVIPLGCVEASESVKEVANALKTPEQLAAEKEVKAEA
jgi:multidrug efflux pump subunit AcrB